MGVEPRHDRVEHVARDARLAELARAAAGQRRHVARQRLGAAADGQVGPLAERDAAGLQVGAEALELLEPVGAGGVQHRRRTGRGRGLRGDEVRGGDVPVALDGGEIAGARERLGGVDVVGQHQRGRPAVRCAAEGDAGRGEPEDRAPDVGHDVAAQRGADGRLIGRRDARRDDAGLAGQDAAGQAHAERDDDARVELACGDRGLAVGVAREGAGVEAPAGRVGGREADRGRLDAAAGQDDEAVVDRGRGVAHAGQRGQRRRCGLLQDDDAAGAGVGLEARDVGVRQRAEHDDDGVLQRLVERLRHGRRHAAAVEPVQGRRRRRAAGQREHGRGVGAAREVGGRDGGRHARGAVRPERQPQRRRGGLLRGLRPWRRRRVRRSRARSRREPPGRAPDRTCRRARPAARARPSSRCRRRRGSESRSWRRDVRSPVPYRRGGPTPLGGGAGATPIRWRRPRPWRRCRRRCRRRRSRRPSRRRCRRRPCRRPRRRWSS